MARAYEVTASVPPSKDSEAAPQKLRKFAGSQSEAADVKREWLEQHDRLKRSNVRVDPVDVPTSKSELIPFLNGLLG